MKSFRTMFLAVVLLLIPSLAFSATLSRQNLSDVATGLEATYASAGGSGDVAPNTDGKTILHVKNLGAGEATVTVAAQSTSVSIAGYGTVTRADIVATLSAGEEAFLGPFPTSAFNNSSGQVAITYGGASAADVDIAALKMP